MTGLERLQAALGVLHWSARDFARAARINERTVRRWLHGEHPVPDNILDWLDDLAIHHQAHPAPGKTREV